MAAPALWVTIISFAVRNWHLFTFWFTRLPGRAREKQFTPQVTSAAEFCLCISRGASIQKALAEQAPNCF